MEHACKNKQSNTCFAAVGQHPILLTVQAGILLFAGFYLLQSEPGDAVLQAAPTFRYQFEVWLTAALVLLEILLAVSAIKKSGPAASAEIASNQFPLSVLIAGSTVRLM